MDLNTLISQYGCAALVIGVAWRKVKRGLCLGGVRRNQGW